MHNPLHRYPIQLDAQTTSLGAVGEILKGAAWFLPPPFNFITFGAGSAVTIGAWFFAKDRSAVVTPNPYDQSVPQPSDND